MADIFGSTTESTLPIPVIKLLNSQQRGQNIVEAAITGVKKLAKKMKIKEPFLNY